MHAFWKRMFPEALTECAPCIGVKEACPHLFFECPFIGATRLSSHKTS